MAQDELTGIVQRMIDAGESEDNIATVIQHYKAAPKGDTYTGPDTYREGFTESLKQTAKDTGNAILGGVGSALNPMTYLRGAVTSNAENRDEAQRVMDRRPPNPNETGMAGARAWGESAKALTTPEGGGQAIGGLITGMLVPRVATPVGAGMKAGSLKLMQSALKPTQSLVNARTGAGFGSKEAVTQAVLDEGRVMSRGSLGKAQEALDTTDADALRALKAGAGQGVTVDPFKVTAAIDAQGTTGPFGKQINAQPDTNAIAGVHESFASNPHISDPVTGMAPIDAVTAHQFASNTGKNLKGKFGRLGPATVEAEKAGRASITGQLRDQIPELKALWDDEARQITTRDALEQAIARRANTDVLGLSGVVGAVKGPSLAALALLDRSGWARSMVAQGLHKGRALVRPSATAIRAAVMAALLRGSEPPEDTERR